MKLFDLFEIIRIKGTCKRIIVVQSNHIRECIDKATKS